MTLKNNSLNLKQFDLDSIMLDQVFILGIGGGNDVVGAYNVARLIKNANPDSKVVYGSCLSSRKKNYIGFIQICDGLYVRDFEIEELNENHSLRLVQTLKKFDHDLSAPYVLISDDNSETERITQKAIEYFKGYSIITVDNGGDSITGGKDGSKGFDYKNLIYFKKAGLSFLHIILGLGCDGESDIESITKMFKFQSQSIIGEFSMDEIAVILSPMINDIRHSDRKNVDTTVIILETNNFIKNNKNSSELYTVPRHERNVQIPYAWLNKAIVFCGQKLCELTE